MNIDTKKTHPTPKDQWEAIRLMGEAQQNLLDALHIMKSSLEFNTKEYEEINEIRMINFIKKFES